MSHTMPTTPTGEIQIQTIAMPDSLNVYGDVFGGWLLSQMDIAGSIAARELAKGRTVTVAVEAMKFHKPMHLGEVLACHCGVKKVGRTSITIHIEAWVHRAESGGVREMVTEGDFVFVAIDAEGRPREVPKP